MSAPSIDQLPDPPNPIDSPDVFNAKAFAFVDSLAGFVAQVNELVQWMNSMYSQDVIVSNSASLVLRYGEQGQWLQMTASGEKTLIIEASSMDGVLPFAIWHIENASSSGDINFYLDGMTMEPPAGGTTTVPPGGVVSVKRTGLTTLKLIGQVVAA